MQAVHPATYTALVFGGISPSRLIAIERLLLQIPALAEGTPFSASVGLHAPGGVVAVQLSLEEEPATVARIRQRLAFWVAREGGLARAMEGMGPEELLGFLGVFRTPELSVRDLSPATWPGAVRRILSAVSAADPGDTPATPELRLHLHAGSQGFTFDRSALLLEVPSPLAPPAGDALRLVLDRSPAAPCAASARVAAVRPPARAGPESPAGFTLALAEGSEEAARLLAAWCPPRPRGDTRAAPRYPVAGRAPLSDPGEELRYGSDDAFQRDYVANLSHGGAFVKTGRPRRIGDRVDLHLRLPAGRALKVPATVVHRTGAGVGLQLELTPGIEEALAAAVAGLAARPRRIVIVDDDALVRRVLTDAFEARGFEVRTAPDGEAGLRLIVDELLGLDAVVTDVHMPGLSGEALVSAVRSAGGEAELGLVVVGASVDPHLTDRLVAAGADRILSKAEGASSVVDAVEDVLRLRAAASAPPDDDAPSTAAPPAAATVT